MTITLTRLVERDLGLLRNLRNVNATAFFDSRQISVADQARWWKQYQEVTSAWQQFYAIWVNGATPVGFLSVTLLREFDNFDAREIGHLMLSSCYRGRGIMHAAITEARRLYSPLTFWIARVKGDNAASLKVFERQEFVNAKELADADSTADLHRRAEPQHRTGPHLS